MKQALLALAFGLALLPAAALADPNDSVASPAALSPAQRQANAAEIQAARQKAMQMHEQLRSQILSALSPDHRTAVANAIGALVISASPDPAAAAKQIDGVLSTGEQQKILEIHGAFEKQMQALMEQLHAQLAHQGSHGPGAPHSMPTMPGMNDAGNVVLMVLTHHPPMEMMHDHGMPMGPGAPQPPGGPPPPDGPPPR